LVTGVCFLVGSSSTWAADQTQEEPVKAEGTAATASFKQPRSLAELLALKSEELVKVDVELLNLLCAEGLRGSENLDIQQCLDTLEAWSRQVRRETDRNFHQFAEHPEEFKNALAYYRMGVLGAVLCEDLRIEYNPALEQVSNEAIKTHELEKWNRFFGDSGDVFIHGLLSSKHHGTCSSMPFLYAAIARRLGYPVTIAARKHHLYARYDDGNGEHLNIEATENRGFATPSDEEFRAGSPPMTEDEIRSMCWLRPLSNKEILAICLLNRSSCLRNMGRYEDANAALDLAAHYQPETTLVKRVFEKNRKLNRDLIAADRWDALWNEVENLLMPSGGLLAEHFRDRRVGVQLFMNQSTNIAEIEKSVADLKHELARYLAEISDDAAKVQAAFSPPQPSGEQQQFLALLADIPQPQRILIPRALVPPEYARQGLPPELQSRVAKLTNAREIAEEMTAFHDEETRLRNVDIQHASHSAGEEVTLPAGWHPHEHFQLSELGINLDSLPSTYRNMEIPPELQRHLVSRTVNLSGGKEAAVMDEIRRFQGDQIERRQIMEGIQKRRRSLDQIPLTQPPVQVQIVDLPTDGAAEPRPSEAPRNKQNSLLTPSQKSEINASVNGKGKP
jgi:hypothetical protein